VFHGFYGVGEDQTAEAATLLVGEACAVEELELFEDGGFAGFARAFLI
jgi:hypothetical protein